MSKYREKVREMVGSNKDNIEYFNVSKEDILIGRTKEYAYNNVNIEFMINADKPRVYKLGIEGPLSEEDLYMEIFFMIAGVFKKYFSGNDDKKKQTTNNQPSQMTG